MTYPTDRHLIGGERAGLVGADDRRTTERLDRRQAAYNGVLAGHTTSAESQAGRDDGRQPFRDGSHRQSHGDLEVVDRTLQDTQYSSKHFTISTEQCMKPVFSERAVPTDKLGRVNRLCVCLLHRVQKKNTLTLCLPKFSVNSHKNYSKINPDDK